MYASSEIVGDAPQLQPAEFERAPGIHFSLLVDEPKPTATSPWLHGTGNAVGCIVEQQLNSGQGQLND